MKFMLYLSDLMIPFLLFGIIGFGLLSGRDVYQDFLDGAREGLKTIASICPTLIGLMTAVGVLRASGLLKYMGDLLGKILSPLGIPGILSLWHWSVFSHPVQRQACFWIFLRNMEQSQPPALWQPLS